MRLAHLADPHLGFRQYHRLTARGQNQREVDVALAFTRGIDGVIAARPDVVVVAGDLFHAVRPTNAAILVAYREFARLRAALPQTPVVVIAGNHDTPRSTDTVSIFGLLEDLGVRVAFEEARRFEFPDLDLSVFAVPHSALFQDPRPMLRPAGTARRQVLVIHGETPGLFGEDRSAAEAGGAFLTEEDIGRGQWSYVALGHYHVQVEVNERIWYAGSLEYVSSNPWGELREQARRQIEGKGWLIMDLDTGVVERQVIEAPRRVLDLRWLDAHDMLAADVSEMIAAAVTNVPGGIADAVVRQVVRNVPRPVARELDHERIRAWKAEALHFQLDLRTPDVPTRQVGVGSPGSRRTLRDTLEDYLTHRLLPPGTDRSRFVERGVEFLSRVEQEAQEG